MKILIGLFISFVFFHLLVNNDREVAPCPSEPAEDEYSRILRNGAA